MSEPLGLILEPGEYSVRFWKSTDLSGEPVHGMISLTNDGRPQAKLAPGAWDKLGLEQDQETVPLRSQVEILPGRLGNGLNIILVDVAFSAIFPEQEVSAEAGAAFVGHEEVYSTYMGVRRVEFQLTQLDRLFGHRPLNSFDMPTEERVIKIGQNRVEVARWGDQSVQLEAKYVASYSAFDRYQVRIKWLFLPEVGVSGAPV